MLTHFDSVIDTSNIHLYSESNERNLESRSINRLNNFERSFVPRTIKAFLAVLLCALKVQAKGLKFFNPRHKNVRHVIVEMTY